MIPCSFTLTSCSTRTPLVPTNSVQEVSLYLLSFLIVLIFAMLVIFLQASRREQQASLIGLQEPHPSRSIPSQSGLQSAIQTLLREVRPSYWTISTRNSFDTCKRVEARNLKRKKDLSSKFGLVSSNRLTTSREARLSTTSYSRIAVWH